MRTLTLMARHSTRRALLAFTALIVSAAVQAQNVNVTAANSINDKVYALTAPTTANTTTVQNTDYKSFLGIQSLAFIVNPNTANPAAGPTLDLVVADTVGGKIAVYQGDFGSGSPTVSTVIWKASQGGPTIPNGLSVDSAGNLWVVNQLPLHPQLWVFPAASSSCTTLGAYPALCQPVLIDNKFPATELLVETASVPVVPASKGANTGDLLVLTFNPSTVLDYAYPVGGTAKKTLITLPASSTPAGLAFWPLSSGAYSLLITNSLTDSILQYSCCSAPAKMANFYNGSSAGGKLMFKIKTGYQGVAPYAFVAQTSLAGGAILAVGEGGLDNTVTQNVSEPVGLAVSNTAFAAANSCATGTKAGGCNPTGVLSHIFPGNTSPALVDSVCVVQPDPRVSTANGWSCTGQPLPVNSVCGANFDPTNKMVIPGWYCGNSGDATNPSSGFTLIKTTINDAQIANGTLIDGDGGVDLGPTCLPTVGEGILPTVGGSATVPPGSSPTLATLLWGPVGEGNFYADGNNTNHMLQIGDGCGAVHYNSGGGSIYGLGLALNLAAVVPVYGTPLISTLGTTVDNALGDLEGQIASETPTNISQAVAAQLALNQGGCVYLSQAYFDFAQLEGSNLAQQVQDYTIAADLLSNASPTTAGSPPPITCDSIVTANAGAFSPSSSPLVLNPASYLRGVYFAPTYFAIMSRVLGNCPNTQSPPNFTMYPGAPGIGGCPTVTPPEWPPNPAPAAPPGGFANACVVNPNQYPPPGGCPTLTVNPSPVQAGASETVSWSLYGSTGCTLSSTDSLFTGGAVAGSPAPTNGGTTMVNASSTPGTYTYTLACATPVASSVSTQVTVSAPPGNPSAWLGAWAGSLASNCSYAGPFNVVITSAGGNVLNVTYYTNGFVSPGGTYQLTINGNIASTTLNGGIYYTLNGNTISVSEPSACQTGTVTLQPSLSVNPAAVGGGAQATVSWVLNGASNCSLTYGQAYGSWSSGPDPLTNLPSSGSATYTSNSNDSADLSGVPFCSSPNGVAFTLSCANNVAVQACLGVSE